MTRADFERARRQMEREAEKAKREAEKAKREEAARAKERERLRRQQYLEGRKAEAAAAEASLDKRAVELQSFLLAGLSATASVGLDSFRKVPVLPPLHLGDLAHEVAAPVWERFAPPPPGFWKRNFAPDLAAVELGQAEVAFAKAKEAHAVGEHKRKHRLQAMRAEHKAAVERETAAVNQFNAELDALGEQVAARDKTAVEDYLLRMMTLVPLPADFPRESKVAFDPRAEHAVVETELPGPECVPQIKTVRYAQPRDLLVESSRSAREKADLYLGAVSQVFLLIVRTLFNADAKLNQISFNGRVRYINTATGHEERPHIMSVVVVREQFESLVLDRVKPEDCLRHLKALVSRHPFELEAVEPLVEFDKSRLAFVEGLGVVSGLDARPNLMAMSPTEFEHLIRELLEADPSIDSIESLTTRQSNDGGVDGVIYIKQPFGRSMTVIQVKQYAPANRLGPVHVRELIGAMHEVKAGNGLLVTTSDFTATARSNAVEFGRISLIDGSNLVFMIKEFLGKDVLIGERVKQ